MFANRQSWSSAALVALAGLACAQSNEPGVWMEGPADAGGDLASAQMVEVEAEGALVRISGELGPQDVDVYLIHVCDPAAFGASTVGGSMVDTALSLFDLQGRGVAMSDDAGGAQSAITAAFMAGRAPGLFYLAVSAKGALPLDVAGDALFQAEPAGVERGPDGPGAAHGVRSFSPGAPVVGPYDVAMSGASLRGCAGSLARSSGVEASAGGSAQLRRSMLDGRVHVTIAPGTRGSVELRYGAVQGGAPTFGADPTTMLPGAVMRNVQFGTLDGVPDQELGTLEATLIGDRLVGGADFSPIAASSYTVSAMLLGAVVDTAGGVTGPGVSYAAAARCKKRTSPDDCRYPASSARSTMANRVDFFEPIEVSLDGHALVLADSLCFCPQDAGGPVDIGEVSSEVVEVGGIPAFVIESGGVTKFDATHVGLGHVLMAGGADGLGIANIGSSGQDGVDVQLPPVQQFKVGLDLADPSTMPAGAMLRAEAFGTASGATGVPLGHVTLHGTGPAGGDLVRIEADLGAISSPTQRIVILSGGSVVADFPGHSGPVGTAGRWPRWLGKLGGRTECFVGMWHAPTTFRIDGAAFVGDEIRILAEGSAGTVDAKTGLRLTGVELGALTITDVDVAGPCAADLDGDGVLTIFDFLAFQNLFAVGDPSADLDGDGALTIFDFLAFQNLFAAGCD
jgi:hypothetical protein